jgi:hypothetical protein
MRHEHKLTNQVRFLLWLFIIGLILSGITAFPIHTELAYANDLIVYFKPDNSLSQWVDTVYMGVNEVDKRYPFIAYGTDWLAFAHLILAVLFIGIVKDPVRNIWVLQFGLISCAGIFPLAFIAGTIRGIPIYWQLIDCSFGLFGGIILWICYQKVRKLSTYCTNSSN